MSFNLHNSSAFVKLFSRLTSADSASRDLRADEPGVAQRESNWAKTGHNGGSTALAVGSINKKYLNLKKEKY